MQGLKIYYLTNCGILLHYNNTSIMIDGLNGPSDFFDDISDNTFQDILDEKHFFTRCDYLLYTHHHFDHFDAERNMRYITEKMPKIIFLPFNKRSYYKKILKCTVENGVELISPDYTTDDYGVIYLKDCCVKYYNTGHIGKENSNVPHYAFILEFGKFRLFFAADSDYLNYEKHSPFFNQKIDIAFYNPFYMNHTTGRKIVKKIGADKNYIYHLPHYKEDIARIRYQMERAIQKYYDDIGELLIIPLDAPLSEII